MSTAAAIPKISKSRAAGDLLVLGDVDYDADPAGRENAPSTQRRRSDALFGDLAFQALPQTATELQGLRKLHTELRGKQTMHALQKAIATESKIA